MPGALACVPDDEICQLASCLDVANTRAAMLTRLTTSRHLIDNDGKQGAAVLSVDFADDVHFASGCVIGIQCVTFSATLAALHSHSIVHSSTT